MIYKVIFEILWNRFYVSDRISFLSVICIYTSICQKELETSVKSFVLVAPVMFINSALSSQVFMYMPIVVNTGVHDNRKIGAVDNLLLKILRCIYIYYIPINFPFLVLSIFRITTLWFSDLVSPLSKLMTQYALNNVCIVNGNYM